MTLDSPDRALEAYVALREAKQLDVEIERKGKAQKLTLEIE
jgi:type II secretory pathway component PulC